jgi:hypothetical protein
MTTGAPLDENYELVFRVPGDVLGKKSPRWYIEGFYESFDEAKAAADVLLGATNDRLDMVSILHARFDPVSASFKERVVWTKERDIALLSRLNLRLLDAGTRARIVDHYTSLPAPGPSGAVAELLDDPTPSAAMIGIASMVTATVCALGVMVLLA